MLCIDIQLIAYIISVTLQLSGSLIVLFKIAELIESFFINKKVSEDKKENEFTEKKTIIKPKKIKKVVNIDKVKGDVYL